MQVREKKKKQTKPKSTAQRMHQGAHWHWKSLLKQEVKIKCRM